MRSNPAKWIIPGILTVLVGTAVTVQTTQASMERDLSTRSASALDAAMLNWAEVEFDVRDARVGGIVTNAGDQRRALAVIESLHGVRSVTSVMDMAPTKSPYPFVATMENGHVHLEGGVPNIAVRDALITKARANSDSLELLAGLDDRTAWLAATDFALRQLRQLDQGEVRLNDLKFSMSGRAKSSESYAAIDVIFNAGLPNGMTVDAIEVTPPLQSPYEWRAAYDGGTVTVTGFVPNDELINEFNAKVPGGADFEPSVQLASGAPERFDVTAAALLEAFGHVENGEAQVVDDKVLFSGAPRSVAALDALNNTLGKTGVTLDLAPPRIDEYLFVADKIPGKTSLSGFVPDETFKETLLKSGADGSALSLGRGAPDEFANSVQFGLAALEHLESGKFELHNAGMRLSGEPKSPEDQTAVKQLVAQAAPEGVALDLEKLNSFVALPYVWAAQRGVNGGFSFSGFVPTEEFQKFLAVHVSDLSGDTSRIASGAPEGFVENAMLGVDTLAAADEGRVAYTGSEWSLLARVSTAEQQQQVLDVLDGQADTADWQISIEVQAAETAEVSEPAAADLTEPETASTEANDTAPAASEDMGDAEAIGQEAETDAAVAEPVEAPGADENKPEEVAAEPATITPVADPAPVTEATEPAEKSALYRFAASKEKDAEIHLFGVVPTDATKRYLGVIAGKVPTDTLYLREAAPEGFTDAAIAGLRALGSLEDGQLLHERGNWSLSGTAYNETAREAALASLGDTADWQTDIALLPPLAICREHIETLADGNTILFNAGSARLTESSTSSIDQLATFLAECPETIVHVEGHTDSDGAETANLALSVDRAEAVIRELIARGVSAGRLYAVGYGESLPIASNETNDGKRRNRRIVFKVLEKRD